MLERNLLTEKELENINSEIMAKIQDAVDYALESPFPALEEALEGIYSV
jgi:TPP-dependent pyruvate/acetoin dehydrogenase alpha subunit